MLTRDEHEEVCRNFYGFGEPGQEGHVIHDRDSGLVRIVNFGKEVWSGSVAIPKKRTHQSLVDALVAAGFQTSRFRQGFARAFWGDKLPSSACSPSSCGCTESIRRKYFGDEYDADEDDADEMRTACVWEDVKDFEDYWDTFCMRPDAWLVLPEHDILVVAEVDFTHHPEPNRYNQVWWWLDSASWSLCELHIDRHGSICSPFDHATMFCNETYDAHVPENEPPPAPAPAAVSSGSSGTFVWRGKERPL